MGEFNVDTGVPPAQNNAAVVGYVRPHDISVAKHRNGKATIEAKILHINPVGPVVRMELERAEDRLPIAAEMTRDQYYTDNYVVGDLVYITPTNVGVFLDYDPVI
jgi:sulfate transport system ATP-binding protein